MKNKKLFYKFIKKKKPKITIVTVVRNAENFLEKTINNIKNQKFKNFEYIVVYTESSDNTWNIILKYKKFIDKIIFCKKIGVYPPMNLAIKFASGKYINFLNAGDYFYNSQTLSEINKIINSKPDVIYGDSVVKYNSYMITLSAISFNKIYQGMIFSHQSCFIKSNVLKKNKFNINYLYASDYDQILRIYNKGHKFFKTQKILSISKSDGIADKNRFSTIKENLKIAFNQNKNFLFFSLMIFIKKYLYFTIVSMLKIFLSKRFFYKIQRYINEK